MKERLVAAIELLILAAVGPRQAWAVQRHVLPSRMPALIDRLKIQSSGRLPAATRLNLVLCLPLHNQAELTRLLAQIYDPGSTNYHHYLTPEEFRDRFGPTEQDYQALRAFAWTNGLTVTGEHLNRTLLDVEGPAGRIEQAFHANLNVYPHPTEARTFYAPATQPYVESAVPLLEVVGLNNYVQPHPKNLRIATPAELARAVPKGGAGPGGAYLAGDLRAAYVPGVTLNGSGQSVALLEFDGYYASDIASYESLSGLPSVPLQNVLLDGFNGVPTTGPNSGSSEVSLDIEMAIAMAPGLSRVLVYEAGPYGSGMDMLNRIATDNLAKQISCSWDFATSGSLDQIFQQFAAQGQTFFDASGDNGAYSGAIPAPDDDPNATIVGGTTLTTKGAGGPWQSETTWNWGNSGQGIEASGGGVSTTRTIPTWQQGISTTANGGSTTMRNIPDVAMAADNIWVVYNNGQSSSFGGTSCAAPLWAAFTALVNQQAAAGGRPPVGFLNPALYSLGKSSTRSSYFHDVTTGNNTTSSSPSKYYAASGYDLCTGWGTPVGQSLIDALSGPPDPLRISPESGFVTDGPVGGPFGGATADFVLTNSGTASLDWGMSSAVAWLSAQLSGGVLAPNSASVVVTVSLTSAAAALPAGTYAGTVWFTNLTSGVVQDREFTLRVGQNLVQNGDFETGDLSYWTLSGLTADTRVVSNTGRRSRPELVHSGTYGLLLGQPLSLATVSQALATSAGQTYLLSLWMDNPYTGDTPNEFQVTWATGTSTTVLYDQVNLPQLDWTNLQFVVRASGDSSVLSFGARNDPQALGLDDITLVAIPQPRFQSATADKGEVTLSWSSLPGLHYQIQYSTNLTQAVWTDLGGAMVGGATPTTVSDTLQPVGQRFYRIVLLP